MTPILTLLVVLAAPSAPLPEQDFYQAINHTWLEQTTIPADRPRWGSFDALDKEVQTVLQAIAEDAAAHPSDAMQAQIGQLYTSGMDTAGIEAVGIAPLLPWLGRIAAIQDGNSLARLVADMHQVSVNVFFGFGGAPDAKDSSTVIAQLVQAGLGLPDRDYYVNPANANERTAYVQHVTHMLALAGTPKAEAVAANVMAFETAMANVSLTAVQRRDPVATYNRRSLADLQRSAPGFAWDAYAAGLGLANPGPINVESPPYATALAALIGQTDLEVLRGYLRWQLLHRAAPYMNDALVQENFAFYGKSLSGTQAQRPRAQRVLAAMDHALGEAMGQLYVARAFPAGAKAEIVTLVDHVQTALAERIKTLAWMGPQTRAKALEKLAKLQVKVGYPDHWIDYSSVRIGQGYLENIFAAEVFLSQRELAKIGKPVDRSLWEMTPQTVDAYYSPSTNEIVFPAAILQPPFFDPEGDVAANYGGIAGVIGHELTHGYDDQGRQYDANGNLQDWWSAEDAERFNAQRAKIVSQFNDYSLFDQPVNGSLTQGENIADLGGVKIALSALRQALQDHPQAAAGAERRFFAAWARIWRNQVRREAALQRLVTDPHAPGQWRVNGPLSNMPDFYAAYGVKPGDGMYRSEAQRVSIW